MTASVPFSILSEKLRQSSDKESFYNFVRLKFMLNEDTFLLYKRQVDQFIINHDTRWKKKSKFRIKHFQSQYADWLQQDFFLQNPSSQQRCKKNFDECSARTKRRRIEEIRQNKSKEEIESAYLQTLRDESKIDAEIVKGLEKLDSDSKELILKIVRGNFSKMVKYTPEEALALMIDLKLTKYQYDLLHSQSKERNADIYPPYKKVFDAKKDCYPPYETVDVTELGANIELQSLLDHTMTRIIKTCEIDFTGKMHDELVATYKWGFDGASGQSLYKQVYQCDYENPSDESIVMISMIPLQIASQSKVLWKNVHPSSTRLCRPIRFDFAKESKDKNIENYNFIDEQINALQLTNIVTGKDQTISIHHKLHRSMFDGKSITHLTNGSTESCNVCFALPSEMNDLDKIARKECIVENYRFGISSLHCWIRFFECIIHIAYRIPFKKRSICTQEHKDIAEKRKDAIQKTFKEAKGLLIDKVKQGSGNSNDGNTARRFFEDCEFAAKTTGVDEELIRRFRTILIAVNSNKAVDIPKFRYYAYETAQLYIHLYRWYFMPPSVHKVLIHGADLMNHFDLPIGIFSEEAQEARNKDFRNARQNNSRKNSRKNTNEDILHWLLISSDPVISSLRTFYPKKCFDYDSEQEELFVEEDDNETDSSN